MYIPKYFKIYELVPPEVYDSTNDKDKLWFLFDDRILQIADVLREKFGKMVCNTWWWGGNSKYRGYRPFDCKVGAKYSQHKFGRALDLVPLEAPVDKVRQYLIDNYELYRRYVTGIELGVSWLHIDCRNWHDGKPYLFGK